MSRTSQYSDDPLNHNVDTQELEKGNDPRLNMPSEKEPPTHLSQITSIERLIKFRSGFSGSFLSEITRAESGAQSAESASVLRGSNSVRGGRALLYPELPWGAPPGWEQGHSRGQTFLICWDILIFLCCLYVAGVVPFELGILDAIQRSPAPQSLPTLSLGRPSPSRDRGGAAGAARRAP